MNTRNHSSPLAAWRIGVVGLCLALGHSFGFAGDAPTPACPNILFAIADDASYPFMGANGCTWVKTPGFDRVAREGIRFTHAYTPNAKCTPSRSCILTGRNPWQLGDACNHKCAFPARFRTYAEALAGHGYFVGKTGKGWAPGDPGEVNGEMRELAGTPFDNRRLTPPTRGVYPNDYAGNFQDFLKAAPKGQPWCFWYGSHEPHRGYEYGSGVAKGGMKLTDIPAVPAFWPDNERVRNDLLDYAFELEYFDAQLVRMLKLLEEAGQLDNTLIIVTADNGMPFPRCKGQEYEFSNHLPLAMMWKRGIKDAGRVADNYVSFIDFAPTFLELAGLKWDESGLQPVTGRSLAGLFRAGKSGSAQNRDHVLIGKERHDLARPGNVGYPIRGIFKGDMLYLRNFEPTRWPSGNPEIGYKEMDNGPSKQEVLKTRDDPAQARFWQWSCALRVEDELYSLKDDPLCLTNLAGNPVFQIALAALKDQLFRELEAQEDPRMFGQGAIFDKSVWAPNRAQAGEKGGGGSKAAEEP